MPSLIELVENRPLATALGEIPNARYFRRSGLHFVLEEAAAGWTSCWLINGSEQITFLDRSSASNAEKVEVVSSSPLDTILGTGCRKVRIVGVRQNGLYREEILDMNGGARVVSGQKYFSISLIETVEAGSLGGHDGQVSAHVGASSDLFAAMTIISTTRNFGHGCAFSLPDDAHGLVWYNGQSGASADRHRLRVREVGGPWQVRDQHDTFTTPDTTRAHEGALERAPIHCLPGSQIEVQSAAAAAGGLGSALLEILFVPLSEATLIS